MNNTKISCPQCGFNFDVEDALSSQVEERLRAEQQKKTAEIDKAYKAKLYALETKEAELEKQIAERTNKELAIKEKVMADKINAKYQSELNDLKKQESEARKEVAELKNSKIENEKLKRQLTEQRQNIELEYEQKLSKQLNDNLIRIKQQETDKAELKIKEYEVQLEQQAKLIDEMKRKSEQGSMQLQGEVQELTIEETLKSMFLYDIISEVGKGIRGADVIQTVRNRVGAEVGTILYESKRTKAFSNEWVSKLKSDAVLVKANICVIVTEAMPDDIERIGQKEGVWICSYADFKPLIIVLRDSLLKISEAYTSQTNKGEKMQMLYDYLLSQEFVLQLSAIVEGFTELQSSYAQEKMQMERIWKKREKQLEKVLLNTNHFIGSIQGIAGSSIPGLNQIGADDSMLKLDE